MEKCAQRGKLSLAGQSGFEEGSENASLKRVIE